MMRSAAGRAGQFVFLLWAITTLLFFMFRLMPGSPLAAYIDPNFSAEQQAALMARFGLDKPLWQQYFVYLGNLVQGDLGDSFYYRAPVGAVLAHVLPNTLVLTLTALVISYGFGIVSGAVLAWYRGRWFEGVGIAIALISRAAPEFWLGMIFLSVFGFSLNWFPSGGMTSPGASFDSALALYTSSDFLSHLILPALTLVVYLHGLPLLLMRSTMLDTLAEEFITMAQLKGLSTPRVILVHAARNALLPVVTAFALGVGYSIGGNVVVETVFGWDGLGRVLVTSVASSDYPLAQGAFLLVAVIMIVVNQLADLIYGLLDPRVAHAP